MIRESSGAASIVPIPCSVNGTRNASFATMSVRRAVFRVVLSQTAGPHGK